MIEFYKEPDNLNKAITLANQIFHYRKIHLPDNYNGFVNYRKSDSKDSAHRLRLIHDQFLQDAFKNNCIGTIYRTEKMLNETNPNKKIHCEHVIPNNLLTKYIFYQLNEITITDLYEFIYLNRIICGVHVDEKNDLNKNRTINNVTSKWVSTHPDFEKEKASLLHSKNIEAVQPFRRYIDTGIKVFSIISGEILEIDIENYTMKDHYEITTKYQSEIRTKYEKAIQMNREKV
jgi:hypothetical protein